MTGNSISGYILPAFIPYTLSGKEPEDKYVLENEGKENAAEITFKRRGRTLFFENIISPAWLYIADISGNMVFRCKVSEAPVLLPLHIQPGIYIACIYTNRLRNQYKFILNE